MRGRAEVPHVLQTIEQLIGYSLLGMAAAAALTALFILLFRVPAKATVVSDGRQRTEQDLRASIILNGVYTNEVRLAPCRVDDVLQFSTATGEEIRVGAKRSMSRYPATLIWYSPADPKRFTALSPLRCLALAAACAATAIWLRW